MDSTQKDLIFKTVYSMLFDEHVPVSINFISKRYQIHISKAPKLLEEFVNKIRTNKKDGKLNVQYFIHGNSGDSEDIQLNRFLIVEEDELEFCNSTLKNSIYHIYSVNATLDGKEPKFILNFEQFIYEPTEENIRKVQSLTYLQNDTIRTRPVRQHCVANTLKYDLIDDETTSTLKCIEEKEVSNWEAMECDYSKPGLQIKRSYSKEDVKRFKRIRVIESDEDKDCDGDIKMKENIQSADGFQIPKLEKSDNLKSQYPKCVQNGVNKVPKPPVKALETESVLKFKTQTQTSIMNFFKKPTVKK